MEIRPGGADESKARESTFVTAPVVQADGTRVTRLRRPDGSEYEVRVPAGAMRGWECYATVDQPWIHEVQAPIRVRRHHSTLQRCLTDKETVLHGSPPLAG